MPGSRSKIEVSLVVCGAWLLIGFVGAAEAAGELARLFNGEPPQLTAMALIFSGVALAVASWRCGRMALDHAGRAQQHDTSAPGDSLGRPLSLQTEPAHDLRHHSCAAATGPQTP